MYYTLRFPFYYTPHHCLKTSSFVTLIFRSSKIANAILSLSTVYKNRYCSLKPLLVRSFLEDSFKIVTNFQGIYVGRIF